MSGIIVCNTTTQVLMRVSFEKAMKLIVAKKATVLKSSGQIIHSGNFEFEFPEIIMLNKFVNESHLDRTPDNNRCGRQSILRRDGWTCAYCGKYGDTIDHIIPKSRNGSSNWDNLITSCFDCNNKKSDKTLEEMGWTLLYEPKMLTMRNAFRNDQKIVTDFMANSL